MRVLLDDGFDSFKTWIAGCSSPQLEKHLPSFFFGSYITTFSEFIYMIVNDKHGFMLAPALQHLAL